MEAVVRAPRIRHRAPTFSIWPTDFGQRVFFIVMLLFGPWSLVLAPVIAVGYAFQCWSVGSHAVVVFLAIPMVAWMLQVHVPYAWANAPARARLLTALLVGPVLAWILLPLSMVRFTWLPNAEFSAMYAAWSSEAAGVRGCDVLAVGGFPLRGICGHGGGGWRDGYLSARGIATFTANMALLTGAAWLLLGLLPERSRRTAWWYLTWSSPSAIAIALAFMIHWWD